MDQHVSHEIDIGNRVVAPFERPQRVMHLLPGTGILAHRVERAAAVGERLIEEAGHRNDVGDARNLLHPLVQVEHLEQRRHRQDVVPAAGGHEVELRHLGFLPGQHLAPLVVGNRRRIRQERLDVGAEGNVLQEWRQQQGNHDGCRDNLARAFER